MGFFRWLGIWLGAMALLYFMAFDQNEIARWMIYFHLSAQGIKCVAIGMIILMMMLIGFIIGWPIFGINYMIWTWQLRTEGREFHRGWKQADEKTSWRDV